MAKRVENPYECLKSRVLLDQVADKWAMLVLGVVVNGPTRFNQLRKAIGGVSQKSLTQCLRKLERNGLIERKVIDGNVIAVEYSITELGESLSAPFEAVFNWVTENTPKIERAQKKFDDQQAKKRSL